MPAGDNGARVQVTGARAVSQDGPAGAALHSLVSEENRHLLGSDGWHHRPRVPSVPCHRSADDDPEGAPATTSLA